MVTQTQDGVHQTMDSLDCQWWPQCGGWHPPPRLHPSPTIPLGLASPTQRCQEPTSVNSRRGSLATRPWIREPPTQVRWCPSNTGGIHDQSELLFNIRCFTLFYYFLFIELSVVYYCAQSIGIMTNNVFKIQEPLSLMLHGVGGKAYYYPVV